MTKLYKSVTTGAMTADGGYVEWKVVLIRTGKAVFYGTYGDCAEWIEYSQHVSAWETTRYLERF